ncbi:MAG: class I SAM-dependent rRNA methyltransferase, partial [Tangfeifania sp.]
MTADYTRIVLKSGKDQSLKRFHPWVFSGAIKKTYGPLNEGDLVEVYSNKDEFLGLGHYQIGSITVRIISFEKTEPDFEFWKNKIQKAWEYRKVLGFGQNEKTNVFRLVHAEGDGLPGLVIDFYNGTAVMQMHSVGMYMIRENLVKALREVLGDR